MPNCVVNLNIWSRHLARALRNRRKVGMSMYAHIRTRAQRLNEEDALRSAVLMHTELLTSRVVELVAQLVVVLVLGLAVAWLCSVYVRVVLILTAAMWRANARAELETPLELFLVA